MAGLEDELDALRRSGYSGEGFHSPGQRLGTGISHNLPPHLARLKALEAAEKRRKLENFGGGSRRLGGGGSGNTRLTPRELAARAALRRTRDEVTCGSSNIAQTRKEVEKAAKEGIESQVIDLTLDLDSDADVIVSSPTPPTAGPSKVHKPKEASNNSAHNASSWAQGIRPVPDGVSPWTCEVCTLVNDTLALQCAACMANPPRDPSNGWICLVCSTENEHQFWMCSSCDSIKSES